MIEVIGPLPPRRLPRILGCLLVLAIAGCTPPPAAMSYMATPIPSREARIWFYRDMNPNDIIATPYVRLNGAVAGVSQPGGAFYRDVTPGHYHIHVDSYIDDPHNDRDVDLAPGAEVYAKILPVDNQVVGGGGEVSGGYRRNTFAVWLYPPDAGRLAVAHSYFQAGGS